MAAAVIASETQCFAIDAGALFDKGILLVPAEEIRGAPAFSDLVTDPPASEREFTDMWKLYFLTLVGRAIKEWGITGPGAQEVLTVLADAELLPEPTTTLRRVLSSVRDYVRRYSNIKEIEPTVRIDPHSGAPTGFGSKIVFQEPSADERKQGNVTPEELFEKVDSSLKKAGTFIWLLLDRLDVAFDESAELERNALRALFRAYRDIRNNDNIRLKIFLRTDIWQRITQEGFREATHITADMTLRWDARSLLHLVVRRILANETLVSYYGVDPEDILKDSERQKNFFYSIFPEQVEGGERQSNTFEWILKRTVDGTGQNVPRELIMFLGSLREGQIQRYERGEPEPPEGLLFERAAFKEALPPVSERRLTRGLYAEYPEHRQFIEKLRGGKAEQTVAALQKIWGLSENEAQREAEELVKVGFFESRTTKEGQTFWVPFLFRPALELVQGRADD
jgi:hypothetical protein